MTSSDTAKSGLLTASEIECYNLIKANKTREKRFKYEIEMNDQYKMLQARANALGLSLDAEGHLFYNKHFQLPRLNYDICYVRHGKTEGNTEPRVFQGNVDYDLNQLNEFGRKQAQAASLNFKESMSEWEPNLIIASPLQRALDTAEPFKRLNQNIRFAVLDEAAEMAFGSWENMKVIDIPPDDIAHLFYLNQNALVKAQAPHIVQSGWYNGRRQPGEKIQAECFLDVIERTVELFAKIQRDFPESSRVVIYGHSMAGAAASILLGHGKVVEDAHYLGFDGAYIMPNATPTLLKPQIPLIENT